MQLSKYFLPILKENPSEAQIISHRLMLRSGMIRQVASGIYTWLPLGLKVIKNIENIVRKNMDAVGCIELLMPCTQPASIWQESGRHDDYGPEMLRIKDRHDNDLLFGPTNEEMITDIFRNTVKSYKDLPKILYQIQWKFRDEIRPRFGVMRGREFLMKDAYSFDISAQEAIKSYNNIFVAYCKTFRDLGLNAIPVKADSGPIGGSLNHEFHIVAETGESGLFYDKRFEVLSQDPSINLMELQNLYAATDDLHDPSKCPIDEKNLIARRGIEVGHIFYFGTKYSKAMKAYINNSDGALIPAEMGSYGIGVSRLVAAIIESSNDNNGIIWPESVAPFKVAIVNLGNDSPECIAEAYRIYFALKAHGLEVLLDDTSERVGSKFATNDLIGTPWQIIIGKKKLAENIVELKHRKTSLIEDLSPEAAMKKIMAIFNVK
jgi:prolyl-tRNA synthetase